MSTSRESLGGASNAPIMCLVLERAYYSKGFFNVRVKYDDHVRLDEGSITLSLSTGGEITGRIDRVSNTNRTARVHGNKALRDWFQAHYSQGESVPVRFDSPYRLTLG